MRVMSVWSGRIEWIIALRQDEAVRANVLEYPEQLGRHGRCLSLVNTATHLRGAQ